VHQSKLLLLDELTVGVDIELRTSLWQFVRELNKEGTSILLTIYYLEEAESFCDRVGIIHHGKLLKVDTTQSLVKQLTTREIKIKLVKDIAPIKHEYLTKQDGPNLTFKVPHRVEMGALIRETALPLEVIGDIKIREGSLEDAFINVVWDNSL